MSGLQVAWQLSPTASKGHLSCGYIPLIGVPYRNKPIAGIWGVRGVPALWTLYMFMPLQLCLHCLPILPPVLTAKAQESQLPCLIILIYFAELGGSSRQFLVPVAQFQ